MRVFIDSADILDVMTYAQDPAITGFTTNATLVRRSGADVDNLVFAAGSKEISVEHNTAHWRSNVRWKVQDWAQVDPAVDEQWNLTAICSPTQVPRQLPPSSVISVFAGRIMDTGRSPAQVLTLAKRTGAQVLWASSRSVYDITLAAIHGCDIITVTPAIYEKYKEWNGMDLDEVARRTIAQFEADRVG